VLRGDARLEEVAAHRCPASCQFLGPAQRRQAAADQQLIPPRAVLGLEQHRFAVGADPRGEPRTLELEQSLEPQDLRLVGGERREHPRQAHPLGCELRAHPVLARGGGVPLV